MISARSSAPDVIRVGDGPVADAPGADGRCRGERGSSVIVVAIVFPVALFMLLAVVQFALWFHGGQVIRTAAQDGARVARAQGASDAEGRTRAEAVMGGSGGLFASRSVAASRQGDRVRVTVTGRVMSILPVALPSLTRTAEGPVERFDGFGDR